jgi:hypothetical protein
MMPRNAEDRKQALAPVQLPDTFADGAWDKVPKTKGTFDFVSQTTIISSFCKNYIDTLFVSW